MTVIPHIIREAVPDDISFIVSTWLVSFSRSYPAYLIPKAIYDAKQTDVITAILEKASVKVAVDPNNTDNILSYIVFNEVNSNIIVHWTHTKKLVSGFGLAKALILSVNNEFGTNATFCSHLCKSFKELSKKYNLIYEPYYILDLIRKNK